jgi:hypothetical protein
MQKNQYIRVLLNPIGWKRQRYLGKISNGLVNCTCMHFNDDEKPIDERERSELNRVHRQHESNSGISRSRGTTASGWMMSF